ncbi:hypothetical protein CVD25_09345 [Bacillus canaveralius]|uniref:Membrane dipeptidase n=1 Tax=Bacillus canaveralius TaxID=1403243 RepID=A0A2N5GKP2_9BACI|nr:hypothetical protein CVD23_18820 [Bacillus sp. V33-4]PLR82081.1 hypothetical protein CU635_12995 [Bacillus canaveralius]PLR98013.1 hypothetical protein CVD25_09345 [Bacillus canaveralius]RSK54406.1 hypothetical protein EJA13_05605 [Bacillus canaveralius]
MRIIDTHCDTLYRIYKNRDLIYSESVELQTNINWLQAGEVQVQFYDVFVGPEIKCNPKFQVP